MTNLPDNQSQYELNPQPRVEYGDLVNSSFRILWNHRILWVAGILTTLLQGSSSNVNFNYSFNSRQPFPTGQPGQPPVLPDFGAMFRGTIIEDIINNPVPYILLGVGLIVLALLIQLIFGTWAQAAMIRMVDEIEATGTTTLGHGWGQARRRLGALIGYKLLLFLPFIALGILVLVLLFPVWFEVMRALLLPPEQMERAIQSVDFESYAGLFCFFPLLICLFIPYGLFVQVIELYAFRSCLLGGTGPWRSITRGWQLFRRQMGNTILTGVFYFILSAIVGVLLLLPILPFGFGMAGRFFSEGFTWDILWGLVPIFIYMIVAGVALGGLIRAYFAVLCTKLYRVAEGRLAV